MVDNLSNLKGKPEYQSLTLRELFVQKKLPSVVRSLVERLEVILPHNMIVQTGFSKMKSTESAYQVNMSANTCNNIRLIKEYFDRDTFECYKIPMTLINSTKSASAVCKSEENEYRELKRACKKKLKRLLAKLEFSKGHQKELAEVDDEIKKAGELLQAAKAKKQRLNDSLAAKVGHSDLQSESVITQMFGN